MAPVRTCVGCRRRADWDELVRVVLDADGQPVTGRSLPGRGAWLCRGSGACLDRAVERRALDRALRSRVDAVQVERLRAGLAGGEGGAP